MTKIEVLLDEAEEARRKRDWALVKEKAQSAVLLDLENVRAQHYLGLLEVRMPPPEPSGLAVWERVEELLGEASRGLGIFLMALLLGGIIIAGTYERITGKPIGTALGFGPPASAYPPYVSKCPECGATFTIVGRWRNLPSGHGQIQITITNTGEQGTLDFSDSTGATMDVGYDKVFSVSYPTEWKFMIGWEEESGSLDPPLLMPGETWNGWLTYDSKFSSRTDDGSIIRLDNISNTTGETLHWVYRTPWPKKYPGEKEGDYVPPTTQP